MTDEIKAIQAKMRTIELRVGAIAKEVGIGAAAINENKLGDAQTAIQDARVLAGYLQSSLTTIADLIDAERIRRAKARG